MEWRKNKWVGIAAGIVSLICIALALYPFIKNSIEVKKARKEGLEWMEQERKWMEEGKWLEKERMKDLP